MSTGHRDYFPPSIERISWCDSCTPSEAGWIFKDDAPDGPIEILSVGYVVAEEPGHIMLAAHINETQWTGVMVIPKSAIRAREVLG